MSFSFSKLFSQDDAADPADPESANPESPPRSSGEAPAEPPAQAPMTDNPFGGFGATEEPESDPARGPEEPAPASEGFSAGGRPFVPDPQPTHRGSFEALFSGESGGPGAPSGAGGRTGEYSIREILPFLPPSLVSTSDLPLDRSFSLPLPESGTEVKLSTIQSVCPEVFGTPITPLNDSEIMLPPGEAEAGEATGSARAGFPAEGAMSPTSAFGGLPVEAKGPVTAGVSETEVSPSAEVEVPVGGGFSAPTAEPQAAGPAVAAASDSLPGGNPFSAASGTISPEEPVPDKSPFPNPFLGESETSQPSDFKNPFAAPESAQPAVEVEVEASPEPGEPMIEAAASPETPETATGFEAPTWVQPEAGRTAVHHSPLSETPSAEENSPFEFPEPKKEESVFGAFGAPPQRVAREESPVEEENPFAEPAAETPGAFPVPDPESKNPIGGPAAEMPDFAKLAEESSLASETPWTVALEPASEAISDQATESPAVEEAVSETEEHPAPPAGVAPSGPEAIASPNPEESEPIEPAEPAAAAAAPKSASPSPSWWNTVFRGKEEASVETSASQAEMPATGDVSFDPKSEVEAEVAAASAVETESPAPVETPSTPSLGSTPETFTSLPWESSKESPKFESGSEWPGAMRKEPSEVPKGDSVVIEEPAVDEVEEAPISSTGVEREPAPPSAKESEKEIPVEPPVEAADPNKQLVFTLRELLMPMAARTGMDFSLVPAQAKVRFPLDLVESQLAKGAVMLTVADLCRYSELETADILRKVDPMLEVPIPENELFHQIQDLDPDLMPASDEQLETDFSTLFASEAENDAGLSWLPASESLEEMPAPEPQAEEEVAATENLVDTEKAEAEETKISATEVASAEVEESSDEPAPISEEVAEATAERAGEKPDPFSGPRIPGPLPARPTPIDEVLEKEEEAVVEENSTEPMDPADSPATFDSLSSLEIDESEEAAAVVVPAPESSEKEELVVDEMGTDSLSDFSFSNFASLDELEPFDPAAALEWPEEGAEAPPAVEEPAPSKPPKQYTSMTQSLQRTREEASRASTPSKSPGGFFEELEAIDESSPTSSSEEGEEIHASAPVVETEAAAPEPPAESEPEAAPTPTAAPASRDSSIRDIELRAVFGTNEEFSYRRVADLAAALPGVEACAIVGPGMAAQSPKGREAGDLAGRAESLLTAARELARATGVTNAETFTLHTEQGVISVFSHEDCCLTVRHAHGQFDPGVREKLILVTRGVTALDH